MTIGTTYPTPEQIAAYVGVEHTEREWLLDPHDVWVKNPHYHGPPTPHPEDGNPDLAYYDAVAVAWDAREEGRHEEADEIMRAVVITHPFAPTLALGIIDEDLPF